MKPNSYKNEISQLLKTTYADRISNGNDFWLLNIYYWIYIWIKLNTNWCDVIEPSKITETTSISANYTDPNTLEWSYQYSIPPQIKPNVIQTSTQYWIWFTNSNETQKIRYRCNKTQKQKYADVTVAMRMKQLILVNIKLKSINYDKTTSIKQNSDKISNNEQ